MFSLFVAKAHLKEALIGHEEALRLHDMCKQLRKVDTFLTILKRAHDRFVVLIFTSTNSKICSSVKEPGKISQLFGNLPRNRRLNLLKLALTGLSIWES